MRDQSNNTKVLLLHPKVRDEVKALIEKAEESLPEDMAIWVPQGLRTIDYQNGLYAQGRTKPGPIVTNAKGGTSYHNYGLAIDFAWSWLNPTSKKYEYSESKTWEVGPKHAAVVQIFKDAGWEWGGDWHSLKDLPHLEKRFGFKENCSDLYQKYLNKDFITGTQYVNI